MGLGTIRSYMVAHSPSEKIFLAGTVPSPLPNGFYKGAVNAPKMGWRGKTFEASSSTGFNNIGDQEKYPFKTYLGKGLQDKGLEVLKIDYDISKNPFYIRLIVDEIVQTAPNKYLGKVHLKLPLGLNFALGYFSLQK